MTAKTEETLGTFIHPFPKPLFETNIWRREDSKNNSYRLHVGHAFNKISQIFLRGKGITVLHLELLCVRTWKVPWNQTAYTQTSHASSINPSQKTNNQTYFWAKAVMDLQHVCLITPTMFHLKWLFILRRWSLITHYKWDTKINCNKEKAMGGQLARFWRGITHQNPKTIPTVGWVKAASNKNFHHNLCWVR